MKKVFYRSPETLPNILHGGHRNPYQFKNAIKSGRKVFLPKSLGLNVFTRELWPVSIEWVLKCTCLFQNTETQCWVYYSIQV